MNLINKIFRKIKEILFKFRSRDDIKLIEEKNNIGENFDNEYDKEDLYPKKDYFLMCKNIKSGIISIDNLMLDDLIKVMMIMNEEISILDKKISNEENELYQMDIRLQTLIKENNDLKNN